MNIAWEKQKQFTFPWQGQQSVFLQSYNNFAQGHIDTPPFCFLINMQRPPTSTLTHITKENLKVSPIATEKSVWQG